MLFELFFLLVVYSVPLGFTVGSLFFSYKRYPSFAILRVISITTLVGIWVYSSLPWIVDLTNFDDNQIILISHIGSIAGSIATIMIATSFAKAELGVITHRSALYSISLTSMLIGIRLIEFLEDDDAYYGIKRVDGVWKDNYHPIVETILVLSLVFLFTAFYFTIKVQKDAPRFILDRDLSKLYNRVLALLALGGSILLINQVVILDFFPNLFLPLYVLSRFCIIFGFLLLAQFISFNPIFIFQEKSNLMKPINEGIIGWMVSYNGDMGPETLILSNKFSEKFNMEEKEITSFSASVITVIGITKSFHSSVFMIPFSSRDLFTTINISFQISEPSLKDPRLNQNALSVLSIIFPNSLVTKIRGFDEAEKYLLQEITKFDTLTSFGTKNTLDKLTAKLLELIIS